MFCGQAGSNMISENAINNNSLVCKLKFKKFSMLFTGDIEEIAEKAVLTKYNQLSYSLYLVNMAIMCSYQHQNQYCLLRQLK